MPGNIINLSPADVAKWPEPDYVDPVRRTWMPAYAGILYGVGKGRHHSLSQMLSLMCRSINHDSYSSLATGEKVRWWTGVR